jgi:hypothetical protein
VYLVKRAHYDVSFHLVAVARVTAKVVPMMLDYLFVVFRPRDKQQDHDAFHRVTCNTNINRNNTLSQKNSNIGTRLVGQI